MWTFYAICAAMLALAIYMIFYPLGFSKKSRSDSAAGKGMSDVDLNRLVLKDQLFELERDKELGLISDLAYTSSKDDLVRRTLTEGQAHSSLVDQLPNNRRVHASMLSLMLILFAVGIYAWRGSPHSIEEIEVIDIEPRAATSVGVVSSGTLSSSGRLADIDGLKRRISSNPNDAEALDQLALALHADKQYQASAEVYGRLVKLIDPDANLLADYADTLAMAQQRDLRGEPEKLIARALEKDPRHLKALALAGSVAFVKQDYQEAVNFWSRILPLVEPNSEMANSTRSNIREAEGMISGTASTVDAVQDISQKSTTTVLPTEGRTVNGRLILSDALRSEVKPTDVVFLVAKAANGPKMPLAVIRKSAAELPLDFVLDDSMSMLPDLKLSNFDSLIVSARISKSGNAVPSSGDLESIPYTAKPGASGLRVEISQRRP